MVKTRSFDLNHLWDIVQKVWELVIALSSLAYLIERTVAAINKVRRFRVTSLVWIPVVSLLAQFPFGYVIGVNPVLLLLVVAYCWMAGLAVVLVKTRGRL